MANDGPVQVEKKQENINGSLNAHRQDAAENAPVQGIPVARQGMQVADAPVLQAVVRHSAQEIAESSIASFDIRIKKESAESGLSKQIETCSLSELVKLMSQDTDDKSAGFLAMEQSLSTLVTLKSENESIRKNGDGEVTDYRDALSFAEYSAKSYAASHAKLFHFTATGSDRYKISCRIADLVHRLRESIDGDILRGIGEPKDEQEIGRQEIESIIETGAFTAKEAGKEMKDWLGHSAEYKGVLKRLVAGDESLKDKDRETLLKFLENKNRLLIANRMTLKMISDEHTELTFRLPAMKKRLNDYIRGKMKESPEMEEKIFSEVEQFRIFVGTCLESFRAENAELLTHIEQNRRVLLDGLDEDGTDPSLWEREETGTLLMSASDEVFRVRLAELADQKKDNSSIVDQIAEEKGYSYLTKKAIKLKLKNHMGALLVFGTETQVADQTSRLIESLKYICPLEAEAEERLNVLMWGHDIPAVRRDALARKLSGTGGVEAIARGNMLMLNDDAEEFRKNADDTVQMIKNSGLLKKKLTRMQWSEIRQLDAKIGSITKKEAAKRLKEILKKYTAGTKISRREFRKGLTAVRKRGIGFSGRILGDQFLDHDEVGAVLNEEERGYLRQHLIPALAEDDATLMALEKSAAADIKKIAKRLRDTVSANAEKLRALRSGDEPGYLKRRVLLRLLSDGGDFDAILAEERAEKEAKSRAKEEMKQIRECVSGIPKSADIRLKAAVYENRRKYLKRHEHGRYLLLADRFLEYTDFYREMMSRTDEEFPDFVRERLDARYGELGEALKAVKAPEGVKSLYLDKKFKTIGSGKLTGSTMFFKNDILNFSKQLHEEVQADGSTIEKNIDDAYRLAAKELKINTKKASAGMNGFAFAADTLINRLYADRSGLETLKSRDALKNEMVKWHGNLTANSKAAHERFLKRLEEKDCPFARENKKKKRMRLAQFAKYAQESMASNGAADFDKALAALIREFEETQTANKAYSDANSVDEYQRETLRKEVEGRQDAASIGRMRSSYLLTDNELTRATLNSVYTNKTLANIGRAAVVEQSHRAWKIARDHISERLSYLGDHLSPVVIDCLVERNLVSWYDEAIDWTPGVRFVVRSFINKGFKKLEEHARWLARVHEVLSEPDEGEEPVSRDELDLMIVNIYRNDLAFTDDKGDHSLDRKDIKGKWYGRFRKNYAELRKLEKTQVSDPALAQERIGMSRDLRALLVTGVATADQSTRAKHDFKSLAARAYNYVNHMNSFCATADQRLKQSAKYRELDDLTRTRYVEGLRKYYSRELIKELEDAGDAAPVFDPGLWEGRLESIIKDDVRMRYMRGAEDYVSGETYGRENKNVGETVGMAAIDDLIGKYAWRSQRKKYSSLTPKQKELFALGLMLMEKGATGTETGTSRVLNVTDLRQGEISSRLGELAKYMSGKPYDFRIDYAQAYYKLTNTGLTLTNDLSTVLSDTAFDKAFEFVEGIHRRMEAATKEDIKRAGDAASNISEAALLGRTEQAAELEKLKAVSLSPEKIKEKLLKYAALDTARLEDKQGLMSALPLVRRSVKKEEDRLDYVMERLSRMDSLDMRRLVAVLQDRTVLDRSVLDKKKSVNDKGYEELELRFLEEDEESALEGYSGNAACYAAISSVLGFKIKDDRKIGERSLTKDDFDAVSFERTGMVDWQLLKRAMEFIDRMKQQKYGRLAVRSASEYIEASGNEKAIAEYRKIQDNKHLERDDAVELLRQQAKKDVASGENKDAMLAVSGFMRLTDAQKKLFFKVLGRRDLLDISKKNIYRNIYNASAERSFVNEAGRYRLIDEYIDSSLGGNEGVTLSDTAYYDAMRSLLSTQVDDTADFVSAESVKEVLAGERCFVMQRSTAIDWKLFSRALQFVNRASYELKIREGNAELYRSAGELSRFGHMSMDYSILRRNIHSTGHHLLRFGVRRGKKALVSGVLEQTDVVLPGGVVFPITDIGATLDLLSKIAPKSMTGILSEIGSEIQKGGKDKLAGPQVNSFYFSPDGLNYLIEKSSTIGLGRGLQKYDETIVDKGSSALKNIEQNENFIKKSARELGQLLGSITGGGTVGGETEKKDKKDKKDKNGDILDRQVGSYKVAHRYGDMRDQIVSIASKYDRLQGMRKKISKLPLIKKQAVQAELSAVSLVRGSLVELFGRAISGDKDAPFYGMLEASYERTKKMKLKMIMDKKLSALIKQGKKKKGEKITEEEIKSHKYWSAEEEELDAVERARAADNVAKDYFVEVLNGMFGEETAKDLLKDTQALQGFTDEIRRKAVWISHIMGAAKVYGGAVMDIVQRTHNLDELKDADKRAHSSKTADKDKKRLEEARLHQTADQAKLAGDTVQHHKDMQAMAS